MQGRWGGGGGVVGCDHWTDSSHARGELSCAGTLGGGGGGGGGGG